MRIGIASLWHETNTFAVEQNDSMDTVHIQRWGMYILSILAAALIYTLGILLAALWKVQSETT